MIQVRNITSISVYYASNITSCIARKSVQHNKGSSEVSSIVARDSSSIYQQAYALLRLDCLRSSGASLPSFVGASLPGASLLPGTSLPTASPLASIVPRSDFLSFKASFTASTRSWCSDTDIFLPVKV